MYATLYQYLVQHKILSIPGIGNFTMTRSPALMDFPGKKIDPPVFSFALHFPASPSPGGFFYWLSQALRISDREAIIRFNDFSFEMRKQILDGAIIDWKGVGVLSKGLAGEIRFVQSGQVISKATPVAAEKVIRVKPEHMVRVGEDEKTSTEMAAMLGKQDAGKSLWWAIPLAIGLLAVVFIGWYFSEHGVSQASTGYSGEAKLMTGHETYRVVQ